MLCDVVKSNKSIPVEFISNKVSFETSEKTSISTVVYFWGNCNDGSKVKNVIKNPQSMNSPESWTILKIHTDIYMHIKHIYV